MKRLLFLSSVVAAMLVSSIPGHASATLYHYGFILSCGETVYRSFNHSLSTEELLEWTDFFESTICGEGTTPSVDNFQ